MFPKKNKSKLKENISLLHGIMKSTKRTQNLNVQFLKNKSYANNEEQGVFPIK